MTPPDDTGSESEDQPTDELPLSLDTILDLLANERRRYLLEYLWEQPDNVGSFEEATKTVLAKIGRKPGVLPNDGDLQTDLLHHHLPKLADAGVIEYDTRSQTVCYRENERLEALYDRVREFELD